MLFVLEMIDSPEDHDFLSKLYERFGKFVRATVLHLVQDAAQADDFLQDTFVRIIPYLDTLRGLSENQRRAYLYRTAKSAVWAAMKPKQKLTLFECDLDELPGDCATPEETLLNRERLDELGAVLGKLPERERQLLFMKYIQGLSTPEISRITGLKPDSVNKRLWDARRHALKLLQGGKPK